MKSWSICIRLNHDGRMLQIAAINIYFQCFHLYKFRIVFCFQFQHFAHRICHLGIVPIIAGDNAKWQPRFFFQLLINVQPILGWHN